MSKRIVVVCAAVLSVAFLLPSESSAQHGVFGYPSGVSACSTGNCGGGGGHSFGYGGGQLKQRVHATQAQNDRIYARNAAWPKPFACASRQLYHNIWSPMYDAGFEDQNILTSTHFGEQGELTRYGKQQISSMLTNMPRDQRVIFVQESADPNETQMRLARVQNIIQTSHPQRNGVVRASGRTPQTLPGWRAVDIIEKATSSAPSPIIPIASGTGGIATAISQ